MSAFGFLLFAVGLTMPWWLSWTSCDRYGFRFLVLVGVIKSPCASVQASFFNGIFPSCCVVPYSILMLWKLMLICVLERGRSNVPVCVCVFYCVEACTKLE